ncbi:MAG TPA: hypothetical protein VEK08_21940 [Planctomycetota bacterium]|nr:hypothetical protein [Planctomycetota bacterium]
MAAKHNYSQNENKTEGRSKRAYSAMTEIRNALYRRYVDYILANECRIRDEVNGEDSYSFTLQQLDEQFLNKLNIVERALAELTRCEYREGQTTTTTYETVEVIAKRDELPQKVADALAEHGDSDFLDMCVLRADEKMAEVLLVLAREENGPPASAQPAERKKHGEQGEQGGEELGGSET